MKANKKIFALKTMVEEDMLKHIQDATMPKGT